MFCKLFENEELGQILVKLDHADSNDPEVRVYVEPKGLGVCTLGFGFSGDDEGWDGAEAWFAKIDEVKATEIARYICTGVEEI